MKKKKMPTLHYGGSGSRLLATRGDSDSGQSWLSSWLLCKVCLGRNHIAQSRFDTYNLLIIYKVLKRAN